MSARTPILPADIRKGDSIRVEYTDYKGRIIASEFWADSDWYDYSVGAEGNTYFLLDRPVPPVALPTEPGYYIAKSRLPWMLEVNAHGEIEWFFGGSFKATNFAAEFAPFTRLEPVADTAKKVLDRVLEAYQNEHPQRFVSDVLPLVGKEFGVGQ